MPSRDAIDERFDHIVRELRTLPEAPESLRERVRELAAQEPPVPTREPSRWRAWLTFRSAAWTVGTAAAGFVAVALAYGVITSGGGADETDGGIALAPLQRQTTVADQAASSPPPPPPPDASARAGESAASTAPSGTAFAAPSLSQDRDAVTLPPGQRLAHHTATMRLRVSDVDELSRTTREAMQIARRLGGFVASVNYAKPKGDEGDASLTLRVPTSKIQQAIAQLSDLGVIVSQQIEITDVQNRVNDTTAEIARLRRTIRRIEARLRTQQISEDERFRLQLQLEQARGNLRRLTEQRSSTVRRALLAAISVTLTTREDEEKVAPPPGRVERAARNAATVLAKELAAIVWVLIVLSPLVLLGAAAVVANRTRRRRFDQRLLEQA